MISPAARPSANWRNAGPAKSPRPPLPAAAQKRPVPVPAGAPPGKLPKKTEPAETIVVLNTGKQDEIGIRTLVGDYAERGINHGKKYYEKTTKISGAEEMNAFLYYWDERDGPEFNGWWFGDRVGGQEVWSRNKTLSQKPPKIGWTIPWDGPVRNELSVMTKEEKLAQDKRQTAERMEARRREENSKHAEVTEAQWEERVAKSTERCAEVELDVTEAIEGYKEREEAGLHDELAEAKDKMQEQQKKLTEALKFVAAEAIAAQKGPALCKADLQDLSKRLRGVQTKLKEALKSATANAAIVKAEPAEEAPTEDDPHNEMEVLHSSQLEEMLPPVLEKVENAEDEVEKVSIAAAPLQVDSGDDLRHVMLEAIKETEKTVRSAQAAIGEARRFISGKLSQASKFAPHAKKTALEEFTTLQEKLTEAQNKLNPFKTVRQDYEKRSQAKKLIEDLHEKLAGAEIEVEKATMMTASMGVEQADSLKETEQTLGTAQSALAQTNRLIESKLRTVDKSSEAVYEQLKDFKERGKLAQEKLDEVRKAVKEAQVRIAADTLMKEVSEKVAGAEDELQRMAEAELPFLKTDKDQNMEHLLADADKVSVKVHAALADAQTFVAKKLVEVARFSEGPGQAVKEEVDMLQKRLEEGRERLQQFRASTAERKRAHLLEEVDIKVAAAEDEVKKMTETTKALEGSAKAGETISESLREAVAQANHAERAAQAGVVVAKKLLVQKTADLKKLAVATASAGSGGELGRLQTRVNSMQEDIKKMRVTIKDTEERIRVKEMLGDLADKLDLAEGEVEKVAVAAVPTGLEMPSADAVERLEKANASAQSKLGATGKLVDVKLKSAEGFEKAELQGMRSRITQAERKLRKVVEAATEQKERLKAAELVAQATEKAEKSEAALKKAGDAELPFLKGVEIMTVAESGKYIAACEAAATAAQKLVSEARAFTLQKLAEAKEFGGGVADTCSKDLMALQKRLDGTAGKLTDLKKDTADRKRKAQLQASAEKLQAVEDAVKNLAETMTKLADSNMEKLAEQEATSICETIAQAETKAQTTVSGAKKFLSLRVQEAKALAEAQRTPIMADLSKLQSRLTASTVELARLSSQATEREHRYVAGRLVQVTNKSLEDIAAQAAVAAKVSASLLGSGDAGSNQALLDRLRLAAVVSALQAHIKKSEVSPRELFAEATGGKPKLGKEAFKQWFAKVCDMTGNEEAILTEEQALRLWPLAVTGSSLSASDFEVLLKESSMCTQAVVAWDSAEGSEQSGGLEVGELVQLLGEGGGGGKRTECVLARDGSRVWVETEANGKAAFKAMVAASASQLESVEALVKSVLARCGEAASAAEKKAKQVANNKGPLGEAAPKLQAIKGKISKEQADLDSLLKRLTAGKSSAEQDRKAEVKVVREEKCKAFAEDSIRQGTQAVEAAEAKASKVIESSKAGSAELLAKELGLLELEELKKAADEALESLAGAKALVAKLMEAHEAQRGPSRNLLLEARVELTKLSSRATGADKKCRSATDALRTAHAQVVKTATMRAKNNLRMAFRKLGKSADDVFEQTFSGKAEVSRPEFQQFVSSLSDHGLSEEQVTLLFDEFGRYGLRKLGFQKAVQEYCTCTREVAITDGFTISSSSTVRKLEKGEYFEVLEGPLEETEANLRRVRGCALRDGCQGWVTVKGNHGTPFLKPREKPLVFATGAADMTKSPDLSSSLIRHLQLDEVLELLEGPREEVFQPQVYLPGRASKDAAQGFLLMSDISSSSSSTAAAPSKDFYICKSGIAMTEEFDISKAKVMRKVSVGETLQVIGSEGEKKDDSLSVVRLKFRAAKDGREGWVTVSGNKGTVYLEASSSHYVLEQAAPLRASAAPDAEVIRQLEPGESFQAEGEAQEVTPPTRLVMKSRSIEDGKVGWTNFVAGPDAPLKPWMPKCMCQAAVDITSTLAIAEGEVRRQARAAEPFEIVEGPVLDASSGLRRVRLASASEGVLGWATVRDAEGQVFLTVG